jgi:hypothetical protein
MNRDNGKTRFVLGDGADPDDSSLVISELVETIHPIDPKFIPGVCLPKALNLAEYGSLNDILVAYAGNGGGAGKSCSVGTFFEDANTNRPLQLVISIDPESDAKLVVNIDNMAFLNGELYSIAFHAMIDFGMLGMEAVVAKLRVFIARSNDSGASDDSAMLFVEVEQNESFK